MANQALINAARSMYMTKAQAGVADYSYVLEAAQKGFQALEIEQEKRLEEGKAESKAKYATVANIVSDIALTDPSVGIVLQEIKDLDYAGVEAQANLFSSEKVKQEGATKRNQAIQAVANIQQDAELLQSFYSTGIVSDQYTPAQKEMLAQLTGDNMKKNVYAAKFKNKDGIESYGLYIRGTKDENGNPYRVADVLGGKIQTVNAEAINAYGETLSNIAKKGRTDKIDTYDAEVAGIFSDNVDALKASPEFGSFAFDKVYGKVWANEEIKARFPDISDEEFIKRKNQLRSMMNGEDLGEEIMSQWGNTTDENGQPTDQPFNIFDEWASDQKGMARTAYNDSRAQAIEEEEIKLEQEGKKGPNYALFFNDLFSTKSGTAVTIPGPSTSKITWNKETGDWSMNRSDGEEIFRGNATMEDLSSIFAALGVPQDVRDNINAQLQQQLEEQKKEEETKEPEKKPFLTDLKDSSTGKNFFGTVTGPEYEKTDKGWMVNSTKYGTSEKYLVTEQDIVAGRSIYSKNNTDEQIINEIASEMSKGTWEATKKRNVEEPNELDEVIQSNNNQTNTEFSGQLSEEASEIINSYRTATELQKAIDDGEITNKEVIDYVSMLKTENA